MPGGTPYGSPARGAGRVTERSNSPSPRSFRPAPVMKSATLTRRREPSWACSRHSPSSAAVSEIIGPAGRPLQRLPPTVAMFQILNEARNARQHCSNSGAASASQRPPEAVELGDGAGRGDLQCPVRPVVERLPARAAQIHQAPQMRLRLGEQIRAPAQPGVARPPGLTAARVNHGHHCVQVHVSPRLPATASSQVNPAGGRKTTGPEHGKHPPRPPLDWVINQEGSGRNPQYLRGLRSYLPGECEKWVGPIPRDNVPPAAASRGGQVPWGGAAHSEALSHFPYTPAAALIGHKPTLGDTLLRR